MRFHWSGYLERRRKEELVAIGRYEGSTHTVSMQIIGRVSQHRKDYIKKRAEEALDRAFSNPYIIDFSR